MTGIAGLSLGAKLLGVGGALKRIPPKVWVGLAIVAALVAGVVWHQHRAHVAIAAAEKRGEASANAAWAAKLAKVAQQAAAMRRKAEALSIDISQDVRKKNDQTNRLNAALADALRVRGPGAARCRPVDRPGVPAGPGGPLAPGGGPDAAGPPMPADDSAAVPWAWLVDRAEQSDANRAEALAWREWYARQSAAWEKFRSAH